MNSSFKDQMRNWLCKCTFLLKTCSDVNSWKTFFRMMETLMQSRLHFPINPQPLISKPSSTVRVYVLGCSHMLLSLTSNSGIHTFHTSCKLLPFLHMFQTKYFNQMSYLWWGGGESAGTQAFALLLGLTQTDIQNWSTFCEMLKTHSLVSLMGTSLEPEVVGTGERASCLDGERKPVYLLLQVSSSVEFHCTQHYTMLVFVSHHIIWCKKEKKVDNDKRPAMLMQ